LGLAKRIIPCLDVTAGRVVKGTNFVDLRDAGDPVEIARRYDEQGADEVTFLDITASSDQRDIILHIVEACAAQVFIPLTVGGGVRSVADVRRLLNAGPISSACSWTGIPRRRQRSSKARGASSRSRRLWKRSSTLTTSRPSKSALFGRRDEAPQYRPAPHPRAGFRRQESTMICTSRAQIGTIAARTHDELVVTAIGTLDAVKTARRVPCIGRSSVVLSTRFEGITYRAESLSGDLYEPLCWPDVADYEIEIDGRTYDAQLGTALPRPVKAAFDAALSGVGAWMAAWGVTAEMADEWGLAKALRERKEAAKARRKARKG
jgi:hypothetical protein